MTASAQSRAVARYGLEWTAELADWLIRWSTWRASMGMAADDDYFTWARLRHRRRELLEVLDYLRATRPEVTRFPLAPGGGRV